MKVNVCEREKSNTIKRKVDLLKKFRWVRKVDYHTQCSNVVLATRDDHEICVDFTNVKFATPKFVFPTTH